MKINESITYDDASVDQVYALITDQDFRIESSEAAGARDIDVTVDESGSSTTVTIIRSQPAELPDFVKKLVGNTVKIKQTEKWAPADSSGVRRAEVKVSIIGQPAEMLGTTSLSPKGDGTSFVMDGEVKVNIPFIGKKIEPEIVKAIKESLRGEVELGKQRL